MSREIKAAWSDPKKRMRIIFIVGIIGIMLIFISELTGPSDKKSEELKSGENSYRQGESESIEESEGYREDLEKRLTEMISSIEGAGTVRVMLLVGSTKEYVFAEQGEVSRQTDSGGENLKSSAEIILADESGEKRPVLKTITAPKITGAAVICQGADDPRTKERIVNTLSALLGLPSYSISVEQMK